jgi:hypothetical protein
MKLLAEYISTVKKFLGATAKILLIRAKPFQVFFLRCIKRFVNIIQLPVKPGPLLEVSTDGAGSSDSCFKVPRSLYAVIDALKLLPLDNGISPLLDSICRLVDDGSYAQVEILNDECKALLRLRDSIGVDGVDEGR